MSKSASTRDCRFFLLSGQGAGEGAQVSGGEGRPKKRADSV
ncbi:hypothetical protein KNP414_04049 [Paenibacillus mucilaginosus KNP414]|uniref:Uncharacterized protein n=1 Tax=Paenibacillus mucilaginosus (strain KNP414) TaxID=1036673 RepID=F8FDL7_PAEMK|nr:hypothetical protein KNP414_04049 [Paenibacillus mucilaginosus KNP414]